MDSCYSLPFLLPRGLALCLFSFFFLGFPFRYNLGFCSFSLGWVVGRLRWRWPPAQSKLRSCLHFRTFFLKIECFSSIIIVQSSSMLKKKFRSNFNIFSAKDQPLLDRFSDFLKFRKEYTRDALTSPRTTKSTRT